MDNFIESFLWYAAIYRVSIVMAGVLSIWLGYKLFVKGVFSPKSGTDIDASIGGNSFTMKNAAPGSVFAFFGMLIIVTMIVQGNPELVSEQAGNKPNSELDATTDTNKQDWHIKHNKPVHTSDSLNGSTKEDTKQLPDKTASQTGNNEIAMLRSQIKALQDQTNSIKVRSAEQDISEIISDMKKSPSLYKLVQEANKLEESGDQKKAVTAYQNLLSVLAVPMNNLASLYIDENKNIEEAVELARLACIISPGQSEFRKTLKKAKLLSEAGN